jgi:hypothetical protein
MLLKSVPLHKYEVRFLLSCVTNRGPWGDAIRMTLKKGPKADLDELIGQLRTQAADLPEMMRGILGNEVYEKLIGTI